VGDYVGWLRFVLWAVSFGSVEGGTGGNWDGATKNQPGTHEPPTPTLKREARSAKCDKSVHPNFSMATVWDAKPGVEQLHRPRGEAQTKRYCTL